MNFGKNIKKIRSIKKLSQTKFAEIFDLTRSSVSAYEEERAEPKLDVIIRIAEYYNITVDKLVNSDITVNEFYKFNQFVDGFAKGDSGLSNQLQNLKFVETPIISSFDLLAKDLGKLKMEQFITLPNLTEDHLAVFVNESNFSDYPKSVKTDDVLVVDKKFVYEQGMQFKEKLWVIKMKSSLYLGELEQLPTGDVVFFSEKSNSFQVEIEKVDVLFPVVTLISNNHHILEEENQQLKKMEYKIDNLFRRIK